MLDINIFFQEVSNPFWDWFFLFVSNITNEFLYIAIIAAIYYALDKEKGLRMAIILMSNMSLNFLLKDIFRIDRPYVKNRQIINKDIETGYGYSFPSGHSQFNSGFFTALSLNFNVKRFYVYIVLFVLLVGFSRIYLGVHTVVDVITGISLGALWSIFINKILKDNKKYILLYFLAIPGIINAVISKNPDGIKILLLYLGFISGYVLENKYVGYSVPGKTVRRILNVLVFLSGLIVIMILSEFIPNEKISLIKYFVIGIWATYICPLLCELRKVKK